MSAPKVRTPAVAVAAALAPVVTLLPIALWKLDLPFVSSTSGPELRVFEIFSFLVAVVAVGWGAWALRRARPRGLSATLPVLLFAVMACHTAAGIADRPAPSPDWVCYERAARAIEAGADPYDGTDYLYPPLTALALATMHRGVSAGAAAAGIAADPDFAWQGVFYLYQCGQFFLVLAAVALCFLLAVRLGAGPATASVLTALLFVLNVPLARTLEFHQVNLWVLDAILAALLFAGAPIVAGLAVAVAIHVKLYAAVLLVALVAARRFAAAGWALAGTAAIAAAQTEWGANPAIWRRFLEFAAGFTPGSAFRDNGLHGIVANTLGASARLAGRDGGAFQAIAPFLVWTATAGIALWFVRRGLRRERSFAEARGADPGWAAACRLQGHGFDAVALALIVSPLVWEHHYVIAMPLLLAAAVTHGRRAPWPIGVAWFLVCVIPVFDVFPFSYHRVAGLWLLLATVPPEIPAKPSETA